MSTVGGYLEYRGDIMMHVGDIMSTVEGVQYHGGNLLLFEYPTILMISPHIYHDVPHGTQISKDGIPHGTHDIPHSTEHPHSTQDIPNGTHDIPHGPEHPPWYCTHIIQGDQLEQTSSFRVFCSTSVSTVISCRRTRE